MSGLRGVGLVVLLSLAAACAQGGGGAEEPAVAPVDPAETQAALAGLKRMSDFLASVSAIRFSAHVSYDAVQESGQKIEFGNDRQVSARRPNRARVEVMHWDGPGEALIYDGEHLSLSIPDHRVYAYLVRKGTTAEAIDELVLEHGVPSPLADLLHPELYAEVADRVTSGIRVGEATLDGVACDQLAFRSEKLDFQIFIRKGDEPVPLRLVIDYRNAEGRPQFRATLRDWELNPDLPEELFRFVPAAGSQRVPFHELLDLLLEARGRSES
jgi:hypothetical protein